MSPLLAITVVSALTATTSVRDVASQEDVLWVATDGGLLRIEGSETRVLTPKQGLPDGTVRAIFVERASVWAGTDHGLAELTAQGTVKRIIGRPHRITALTRHQGHLFVGTLRGLFRLKDAARTHANETRYTEEGAHLELVAPARQITALASANRMLYAASAAHGALMLDHGSKPGRRAKPSRRAKRSIRPLVRLGGERLCWDIAVRGDEVWFATSRGLQRVRAGSRRLLHGAVIRTSRELPVADLRAVVIHRDRIFVGSYGGGVSSWNPQSKQWTQETVTRSETNLRVTAIAQNPAGALVVASDRGLWPMSSPQTTSLSSGAPSLPSNDLTSLALTEEGLWIGTFDSGLALLATDGTLEHWSERQGLIDNRINRLAVDNEGALWVATDRGVMQRRKNRFIMRGLIDQHVFALGGRESMFAGAGKHLYVARGQGFVRLSTPGSRPQDIVSLGTEMAVATAEGLARRNFAAGAWSLTTSSGLPRQALPDDWVTAVAGRGPNLYVGTYNRGVARVHGNSVVPMKPDLWVNAGAMLVAHHALWVGTLDQGLWVHTSRGWSHATTDHGLPDNDVTDVIAIPGTLDVWVATRGGLARVRIAGPRRARIDGT